MILLRAPIRRCLAALVLVLTMPLLASCWDRTEINDIAIVTGAGFDLTDDNKIKLTAQLFIPNASSEAQSMGSSPTGGSKQSLIESASGLDTADAEAKLQELLSRKFFWGQSDVFIFGEKLVEHGIADPMDFLTRHPHPRERANVYMSRGTADQILKWQPNIERNSSEVLREMSMIQTGLNITLLELVIQLSDEAHTGLIPYVSMTSSGNKKSPYIGGAVSIKSLKMDKLYNAKKTRGLLWLRDEVKSATLTSSMEGSKGLTSMTIVKSHCNLKPSIVDGKWMITVQVKGSGNLTENTTQIDVTNPDNIRMMEKKFSAVVIDRINSAVTAAQKSNTDILGFAEQFHRHYAKEWKQNKQNWNTLFPQVEVKYDVKLTILRTGLIGQNKYLIGEQGGDS